MFGIGDQRKEDDAEKAKLALTDGINLEALNNE